MMTKRQISFILISFLFSANFFLSDRVLSVEEINKKLELKRNYSHLLSFDEKIVRYRAADKDAFQIEILPDIFNDRHEMLIKPLQEVNTNLLVWTQTNIYNFDIKAEHKRGLTKFFSFNNNKQKLSKELSSLLGDFELDLPPSLPQKQNINEFELDLPPELKD